MGSKVNYLLLTRTISLTHLTVFTCSGLRITGADAQEVTQTNAAQSSNGYASIEIEPR